MGVRFTARRNNARKKIVQRKVELLTLRVKWYGDLVVNISFLSLFILQIRKNISLHPPDLLILPYEPHLTFTSPPFLALQISTHLTSIFLPTYLIFQTLPHLTPHLTLQTLSPLLTLHTNPYLTSPHLFFKISPTLTFLFSPARSHLTLATLPHFIPHLPYILHLTFHPSHFLILLFKPHLPTHLILAYTPHPTYISLLTSFPLPNDFPSPYIDHT